MPTTRYLQSLAEVATILFRTADLGQSWQQIVDILQKTTGADRVCLMGIDLDAPPGQEVPNLLIESFSPGLFFSFMESMPKYGLTFGEGFQWLMAQLRRGGVIQADLADIPLPDFNYFSDVGIQHFIAIPIFQRNHVWGTIGFDSCKKGMRWQAEEIDLLKSTGHIFGIALERQNWMAEQRRKEVALRELLEMTRQEKSEIEARIRGNVRQVVEPIISRLRLKLNGRTERRYLDMLESNLEELTGSYGTSLREKGLGLTSRELEVCEGIRQGMNSKEIAELLCISKHSVDTHRQIIRKKLGLTNKRVALATYLRSM